MAERVEAALRAHSVSACSRRSSRGGCPGRRSTSCVIRSRSASSLARLASRAVRGRSSGSRCVSTSSTHVGPRARTAGRSLGWFRHDGRAGRGTMPATNSSIAASNGARARSRATPRQRRPGHGRCRSLLRQSTCIFFRIGSGVSSGCQRRQEAAKIGCTPTNKKGGSLWQPAKSSTIKFVAQRSCRWLSWPVSSLGSSCSRAATGSQVGSSSQRLLSV